MRLLRHCMLMMIAVGGITLAGYFGGSAAVLAAFIGGQASIALGYLTRVNYEHYRGPL